MSEKNELPTAKRLRDARREGQVPRSKLFSGAAASFGGLLAISATGPSGAALVEGWTTGLWGRLQLPPSVAVAEGLIILSRVCAPVLGAALFGSFLASTALTGFQINLGVLAPKLNRLDPAAGLKKLFRAQQWFDAGKAILVAVLLVAVIGSSLRSAARPLFGSLRAVDQGGMLLALGLLRPAAVKWAAVLAILGGGDYLLARRRHLKGLMMSREEKKREHKDAEGDPRQKGKRKAMHRQMAHGGAARGVQKAHAIVVNPTHIAVALRYDEAETDVPYIVAKGREVDALQLRERGRLLGIPIVKDVPLARSLIHYDVGEEIPEELYRAAAAVLKVALDARPAPKSQRRRS